MYGVQYLVEPHEKVNRVSLCTNEDGAFGLVFESMGEVESWITYMRSVAKVVFEGKERSTILPHPQITG